MPAGRRRQIVVAGHALKLMAFNPALPADHAPIVALELRTQFNSLNTSLTNLTTQVNALPTLPIVLDSIRANAASNVDALVPLTLTVSNPPTQAQVQAVVNKLNELLNALYQTTA